MGVGTQGLAQIDSWQSKAKTGAGRNRRLSACLTPATRHPGIKYYILYNKAVHTCPSSFHRRPQIQPSMSRRQRISIYC